MLQLLNVLFCIAIYFPCFTVIRHNWLLFVLIIAYNGAKIICACAIESCYGMERLNGTNFQSDLRSQTGLSSLRVSVSCKHSLRFVWSWNYLNSIIYRPRAQQIAPKMTSVHATCTKRGFRLHEIKFI